MDKLNTDEYIQALEIIKNSPKDRIGILGDLCGTGMGVATGYVASGAIASLFGVTTLFGSSTLASSLLGGIFVVSTPVGWLVGSTVAAGAIGYGITKLIRSGEKSDTIKEMNIRDLKSKINKKANEAKREKKDEVKYRKLIESLQLGVYNKKLSQKKSNELLNQIKGKRISIDYAFKTIQELLK